MKFALKDGKPVAWLAPSYRMLADNYRMLANTLSPVITSKQRNERIELLSGGYIDFWSLEQPDRIRGRKYQHLIINEAAMVGDLEDIYSLVLVPTLFAFQGSCDFYSTPKGLNGFFNFYNRAVDFQGWERFHYTSYDNPTISKDEIEAFASTLPERVVKQEIMAEFLEDGAYFQGIEQACTITDKDTPDMHAGHYLVAGLDWAKSEDYTVLTIACRDCNRVVCWDRFNQIDYTYQRERVLSAARAYNLSGLLPERNSIGEPNIEILIGDGLPILPGPDGRPGFNTTATTKPALIQGLAAALVHHQFKVPKDYADELRMYQVETTAAGASKFSAPVGQHDDRVISLALAWRGMTTGHVITLENPFYG